MFLMPIVQVAAARKLSRLIFAVAVVAVGASPVLCALNAQERPRERTRERPRERPRESEPQIRVEGLRLPGTLFMRAADRAVIGVMLGAGSAADTAGVRIQDVRPDGPAAKAGFEAGDIITDINGVSLKVSRDDAEDLALTGIAQRRLQRTMAKAKPGDEVELRVRSGGAQRSVKVKAVSAAELEDAPLRRVITHEKVSDHRADNRAAVGVTIGGTGNARDTLGLFVSSVVTNGPAEKAGVVEGERIVSVNGVDLRVPKEDLDDMQSRSARVDRFVREIQQTAPGARLTLRVNAAGRTRDVVVNTVPSSSLDRGDDLGVMIRESMNELRRSLQRSVRVVRIDA